ncbi:hypothetical protein E2562_032413 [Oryza meyeriana var. granulata]|uniref:Uncharacterized protein n=1 Tax=Oryza meyeriana var. granulata TaxID=110450 RepID=A0A6G1CVM1_9ORYZ|nr:hypothetical protein E2562_032413 [Oryza meyeriana var. granulata]
MGAQQPFLYAHAPFPLFSTQPPPAAPAVQVPLLPPLDLDGGTGWLLLLKQGMMQARGCTTPTKRISCWAKKGKGTADEVTLEVREHLQTLMQTQATQKEELEGIKDHQQKLSDQRVETATLQLKAAQEKEAKLLDHKIKWSAAPCPAWCWTKVAAVGVRKVLHLLFPFAAVGVRNVLPLLFPFAAVIQ